MSQTKRPRLELLEPSALNGIVDEAMDILERVGVFVENEDGKRLLEEAGAKVDHDHNRVHIPRAVVEGCLKTAPGQIRVYDRDGRLKLDLQDDNVHFDPGSAALRIFDPDLGQPRDAMTADLIRLARLVEELPHYPAQSTAVLSADVPQEMADRYRLLIALTFGTKPVITGTFAKEGFAVMHRMLAAVRGGAEALREKPLAIFDCCPSPPLKWSDLTCQSLIDAARAGIPSEFVSMPLTGANAPVTLLGAIVQHAAETLAGIVISQSVQPGAPVIWGGSPSASTCAGAPPPWARSIR